MPCMNGASGIVPNARPQSSRRTASFMGCCFASTLERQQSVQEPRPHPPSTSTSHKPESASKLSLALPLEPPNTPGKPQNTHDVSQSTALSPTETHSLRQEHSTAPVSQSAAVAVATAAQTSQPSTEANKPLEDRAASTSPPTQTSLQAADPASPAVRESTQHAAQDGSRGRTHTQGPTAPHTPFQHTTSTRVIPPGIQLQPLERPITIVTSNIVGNAQPHMPAGATPLLTQQQHPSAPPTLRRVTEPPLSPPPPHASCSRSPLPPTLTIATLDSIHTLEVEWNTRRSNSKRNQLVQSWLHTAAQEAATPAPPQALFSPPGLDLLELSCSEDDEVPRSVALHPHIRSTDSSSGPGLGPGPSGTDSHERGTFPVTSCVVRMPPRKQAGIHSADGGAPQGSQQQLHQHQQQRQQRLEQHHSSRDRAHSSSIAMHIPATDSTAYSTSSVTGASLPPLSMQPEHPKQHQQGYFPPHPATRGGMHSAKRYSQTLSAGQVNLSSNTKPPLQQQPAGSGKHVTSATVELRHAGSSEDVSAPRVHRSVSRTMTNPLSLSQHRGHLKAFSGSVKNLDIASTSANQTLATGSSSWCPRVTLAPRGTISVTSEVTTSSSVAEHVPLIPARALAADSQNTTIGDRFRCVSRGVRVG